MMNKRFQLIVCVLIVLVSIRTAHAGDQITPPNLRVQPLKGPRAADWITLEGYREIGSPVFSPDGQWIAFDGYKKGFYGSDAEIWVARRDGTELRRLAVGATPRWSPGGKELLFMRERSQQPGVRLGVYMIDADGKNERWICEGRWPDWSPDGKRIAFSREAAEVPHGGVKPGSQVYVANADGTNAKRIGAGDCPSWSPDGKWIACCVMASSFRVPFVRLVEVETGKQKTLGYGWYRANWSPDGKSVVANGLSPEGRRAMVRLRTDAPFAPEVLFPAVGIALSPCVSPDGNYLVFVADRPSGETEK